MKRTLALCALLATWLLTSVGAAAQRPTSKPATSDPFVRYGYSASTYKLPAGPHLFIDYRYIDTGQVDYKFSDGSEAPRYGGDVQKLSSIRSVPGQAVSNIRIEAQPAQKFGPIIESDQPWEFMLNYATLMQDQGKFRLWYEVANKEGDRGEEIMCYAESTDGVKWTKPRLGLIDFAGSKDNNIIYSSSFAHQKTFQGSSVFVDPIAPNEERYKIIYMSEATPDEVAAFTAAHPQSVSRRGLEKGNFIRLASSPDGIHFTPRAEPLMLHQSDTQTTVSYDPVLQRYVSYFRLLYMDRRAIGRSESPDLSAWPIPRTVLFPNPLHDAPSEDYYISGYCRYPGTETMHLMVSTIYNRHADATHVSLASSMEGEYWTWLPGGPILEPGPDGAFDGGCIFAGINLTELPGDDVVFPYKGYRYPHKFPRWGDHMGTIALAGWKKERLAALIADENGEFMTRPLCSPGTKLFLNFQTRRNGYIKVSLTGDNHAPIENRTSPLCDPLVGDEIKKEVTWQGEGGIGINPGKPFTLHFEMRDAKLYSFELR